MKTWILLCLGLAACHGKPAVAHAPGNTSDAAPTASWYCSSSGCETSMDECNATAMGYPDSGPCEPTPIVYCVSYQWSEGGEQTDCFAAMADCQALVARPDPDDSGIQSGTMGTCAKGDAAPPASAGWYCNPDAHLGCARTQEACGDDCTQADSAVCTKDGHCFADDDTCQQYLVEMGPSLGCTETP